METSLFNRLQATLLAVATVGLFLLAVLNLLQERQFQQPDDGVWWREVAGGLEAVKVLPDSPGERAGIQEHDLLRTGAAGKSDPAPRDPVAEPDHGRKAAVRSPGRADPAQRCSPKPATSCRADLEHVLYDTGIYGKASYAITRDGIPLDTRSSFPSPWTAVWRSGLRIIGLIYLAIGIYVLFRRWTAPRATHFYLFCLVSFALYALKYTGKLDRLDWTVFWLQCAGGVAAAGALSAFRPQLPRRTAQEHPPPLALAARLRARRRVLGLWIWAIHTAQATGLLKHRLDQTGTGYDAAFYVLAAALPAQLQPRRYPFAAPAIEVAHPRRAAGGRPLYALLRHSLSLDLRMPSLLTNLAGLIAGLSAPHLQLGHRPLPADGYRPDLQARRSLHAGHRPARWAATSASSR